MYTTTNLSKRLWPHQRKALTFVVDWLNQATSADKACLVRMPTGTGKTGVIACLSMLCAPDQHKTLVLTPWTNLRTQMVGDLHKNFWEKLGCSRPRGVVSEMLPSTAKSVLSDAKTKVVICTFATLNELRKKHPDEYKTLSQYIHTVIVDECHYEPAVEWGKSVKGLDRKMVLLTATPYRNDLKLFRIEDVKTSIFQFTHEEAERKVIRPLSIMEIKATASNRVSAADFLRFWNESKENLVSPDARAIIYCETHTDIASVVEYLRANQINAIGVHDRFDGKKHLLKNVPSTDIDADVWVHQKKLTEGLDDHRFCCLALLGEVRNDRRLIQMVGRILRRDKSDRAKHDAILLAPSEYRIEDRWHAYRDFEKDATPLGSEHYRSMVNELLSAQPETEYFDGRFRRRFNQDDLSRDPQVNIAPSVLVRAISKNFNLKDYIEDCTDTLNLTDAIILGKPNSPCHQGSDYALWVYASIGNSRLLDNRSLYEIRLEAHCVVVSKGYVFASDTTGTFPADYLEAETSGIGSFELSSLMGDKYRITNISTSSSVPFDTVLRASEHRGHDLAKIPVSLTDRIQICQAARGASPEGRRYLGLQRGRIRQELTDAQLRSHSLTQFCVWARDIAKELHTAKPRNNVLQRYMQACTPPQSPCPVALSIDLHESEMGVLSAEGKELLVLESSVPVKNDPRGGYLAKFEFHERGNELKRVSKEIALEYQPSKGRFWFKSGSDDPVGVKGADGKTKSLIDYLNVNQEVILIGLDGGELVYQGRNFYKIDYSYAEIALLEQIERLKIVPCKTEKGTEKQLQNLKDKKQKTFAAGSIFKSIADGKLPLPFKPELVICDDLGTETADFILASFSESQLALVHAKVGKGTKISASAFHDVVSQAMKNLVYLSRNAPAPDGVVAWSESTFWNKTKIPRLYQAPRKCPTGISLWKKLRTEIIDRPGAQLHVVLATAGCCDRDSLAGAIKNQTERTPETAQLLHLLDGLNGYSRQLGVLMKVYDIPYPSTRSKRPAKTVAKPKVTKR